MIASYINSVSATFNSVTMLFFLKKLDFLGGVKFPLGPPFFTSRSYSNNIWAS